MRGMSKAQKQRSQHQVCLQNVRHQKCIWEHHMWCHFVRGTLQDYF